MTPEQKIVISLAMDIAREESSKSATAFSDEGLSARSAEIVADAFTDNPQTEIAIVIVKKAKQIILDHENGIESPYFPKPSFDMNEYYGKTVNISIKPIFEIIAKYSETLGRQLVKPTKESDDARLKIMDDMSIEVFNLLNANKVPLIWYVGLFQDLKDVLVDLDTLMKDQVKGHIKEITSRIIGSRHPNPTKNVFDSDYATYEELIKTRQEVKEKTGGKDEDYFVPKDTME